MEDFNGVYVSSDDDEDPPKVNGNVQVNRSPASGLTVSPTTSDTSNFVRRSTRVRKQSVRLVHEEEPEKTEHNKTKTKKVKQVSVLEPEDLLSMVLKTGRKIFPGMYGVKIPTGPDHFVVTDGVEYLMSLGHDKFCSQMEEVLLDEKPIREKNRIKSSTSKSSFASSDTSDDWLNDSLSEDEEKIWVKSKGSVDNDPLGGYPEDEDDVSTLTTREYHNSMERMRRHELKFGYGRLAQVIEEVGSTFEKNPPPKVMVLHDAVRLIRFLRHQEESLIKTTAKCREKREKLMLILKSRRKIVNINKTK